MNPHVTPIGIRHLWREQRVDKTDARGYHENFGPTFTQGAVA